MGETTVSAHDRVRDGQLEHVRQHTRTVDSAGAAYSDELPPEGTTDIETQKPAAAPTVTRYKFRYEKWDLNSKGNGTVTYRRVKLPGEREYQWANDIGTVTQRERGGTYRSSERNAESYATLNLPVGSKVEIIDVHYSHGQKSGSSRRYERLDSYVPNAENPGKWKPVWVDD